MSSVAPTALEQRVNLVQMQDGIPIYLWIRSISFLTVREQAVSVRGMSRFFRQCSQVYMQKFWSEPKLCLPQDASSLARAMEMCQYLRRQKGYVEGATVVVVLGSGVYEVVGSCYVPNGWDTNQKTLSVPFDNMSFVGQGERETIVDGAFYVEKGRKVSFEGLTVKNSSRDGLRASGVGTKMVLKKVIVENCQSSGVFVTAGANLDATGSQFYQNGGIGVYMAGSTTTARLTNCTSHHNKGDGVRAWCGAVVDLMGEGTSVHDNEEHGLNASCRGDERGATINVYQPCVLNDMSHGNNHQNIYELAGGIVQQKDSKK